MPETTTSLLEIVGIICVLVAAFATSWCLGLAVLGVALISAGYVLGQPDEEPEP